MVYVKYLIIFIIFYIIKINAQDGMCGGKELTREQSNDAWKCVGLLKQRKYSFPDDYTATEKVGSCTCQRTGPITYDRNSDVWDDMNQCASPGSTFNGGRAIFHYDEGSGCWDTCKDAFCHCWILTYNCSV